MENSEQDSEGASQERLWGSATDKTLFLSEKQFWDLNSFFFFFPPSLKGSYISILIGLLRWYKILVIVPKT